MIRLSVPGKLAYRDLALRVVAASCKLCRSVDEVQDTSHDGLVLEHEFDMQVISAFGEAFNNVAIHGYCGTDSGVVEIEIDASPESITIRIFDTGRSFDPTAAEPPAVLPESGMGLYIIRSFMDSVSYKRGDPPYSPNELCLVKRCARP
jgi:serine/threonine-protein kinase RsbW